MFRSLLIRYSRKYRLQASQRYEQLTMPPLSSPRGFRRRKAPGLAPQEGHVFCTEQLLSSFTTHIPDLEGRTHNPCPEEVNAFPCAFDSTLFFVQLEFKLYPKTRNASKTYLARRWNPAQPDGHNAYALDLLNFWAPWDSRERSIQIRFVI
jgi:hypothetical protein